MVPLIDTHIHLDAPELCGQGFEELDAARHNGIEQFVIPGVRVSGWAAMPKYTEQYAGVFLAPGLHPANADQWCEAAAHQLREPARFPGVVAVGEIGLDRTVAVSLEQQQVAFCAQLDIALDAGLPVLLHVGGATGAVLNILREYRAKGKLSGIWHGFSESLPVAHELVALGVKIGVGPVLLYENARKLPEVVKTLPLSTLVLETDFPDMAETPVALVEIAEKIARLRGIPVADIAQSTTENAQKLFGL